MRFERAVSNQRSAVSFRKLQSAIRNRQSAMTLVELLVVIVLVTTLVTTVIPILSPGGDNKRIREASRNLNAYLQGAQARAIETGRPFGVAFQRLSADTERGADNAVCVRAEYVEVPPHYSGMDSSSLARVCIDSNSQQLALQFVRLGTANAPGTDMLPAGYDVDLVPDRFLRPGDTVVVGKHTFVLGAATGNFAGRAYTPIDSTSSGQGYFNTTGNYTSANYPVFSVTIAGPDSANLSFLYDSEGVAVGQQQLQASGASSTFFATAPTPYQIQRQPVPAGGEPLEMPGSVAVDLQASVFTSGLRVFRPSYASIDSATNDFVAMRNPVMVLFSPQGNIDRVYGLFDNAGQPMTPQNVTSTLALCVGRRELIPPKQTEGAAALTAPMNHNEPINLERDIVARNLSETEAKVVMDQYNWLNLDSRWVLVGGQSGAVSTIATSGVYPGPLTATVDQQLAAAIENASSRTTAGGR
ncbi:prepilin-type N-terminal cleavage/methylation domain-containing protein [Botrimarina mediterranea]|uniref:Uncharacterized protein n=1 Tax=Botrimarina mediterranea TaxID=2528022 RepID=A0A518K2X5_9BACT|nr:prepilin-type N-terminal cleavage/methylation domain-containing protein [Botrimarina mediterranea]QDV72154.1 hypothetical protein Spa11_03260 [Botrimarina mediterranea]